MIWIARRMQDSPNRVQTIIEGAYDLTYTQISRGNMPGGTAARFFPFVATLFFFIWFSNMLGYIPLPTNTHETVDIFGIGFPSFALYAGHREPVGPAGAHAHGVHPLSVRGHPPARPHQVPEGWACPLGVGGRLRDTDSSSSR
jgi:hypothetical protein